MVENNVPEKYVLSPEKSREFHEWRLRSTLRSYLANVAAIYTGSAVIDYLSQREWNKATLTGLAVLLFIDMGRIQRRMASEELEEILKR